MGICIVGKGTFMEMVCRKVGLGVALATMSLIALAAQTTQTTQPRQGLPDGPGREAVQTTCTVCHGPAAFTSRHMVKADWKQTLVKMQGQGAEISDDNFDLIADYLAAHFGVPINVNKATEQDFVDSLSMTGAEAQAIVKYRAAHEGFKSMDDLLKVPDIDAKKIQSQSANILFQDPAPALASSPTPVQ